MKKAGELVEVLWDCPPDYEYVYGHVSDELARACVAEWAGDLTGPIRHTWARWTPNAFDDLTFRAVHGGGRGCFRVTEVAAE